VEGIAVVGFIKRRLKLELRTVAIFKQRAVALVLLVTFLGSIGAQTGAVYAISASGSGADLTTSKNYPGPLPSARALDSKTLLSSTGALSQEVVQGTATKPAVKTGEITDKRTANTSQFRNADGTVTEKLYTQPIHYKQNGVWQDIDTTLVEDKNAGDAGTIFGKTFGQIESWASSTNNYQVKANDWTARFSPSDSDQGMVRIKKDDSQIGFVPLNAKSVAPVITTDDGHQTVHYYDLWPGVNVSYVVTGGTLKESIELKNKDAADQMQFKLIGADLAQNGGGFTIKGAFGDKFVVTPINLMLTGSGPVTDTSVFNQSFANGVLTVGVDKNYLQNLPASAFPAVIDPGIDTTTGMPGSGDYKAIKSDGTVCTYTSSPQCKPYVGGLDSGGGVYKYWRTAYYAPYSSFSNPNKRLVVAKLYFNMQGGAGYHGTTSNKYIDAWRSTCNNAFGCVDTGNWGGESLIGSSGEINLTALYQSRIAASDYGMWLMLTGEESSGNTSFKEFDPAYTYMSFTWGDAPPAPTILSPAANGQVFTDPQVSFRLNTTANPNNSTPLLYETRVSSSPNGAGTLIDSGQVNATQWTIPDGMLQDGSTYYAQARTCDPTGAGCGDWSSNVSFKIDMRAGKDATQTYDTVGPLGINLATGDVSTSASSHTSAALGGSLGVGLDYNSPLRSRPGLRGQYWSNTTMTGQPAVDRVDQNIDFDWGTGSPSGSLPSADNFSAKWTGYFVAPTTGAYYFGGNNDDSFSVTVNGVSVYSSTGCGGSSVCYGASTVSLTAGQTVPIVVTYVEQAGLAVAKLWAKGAVSEGAVPSTWLRTDPRPTAQTQGLIGRYYFDDGSHDFSSSNNTLFMQRNDTWVGFNWGSGGPVSGGPTDNFLVRWTGYVTVPVGGTYEFGANSDDGVRIKLGAAGSETTVLNAWADQGMADRYDASYSLAANVPVPITVEYYEHTGGAAMTLNVKSASLSMSGQMVPSSWLSPSANILPAGWSLGLDADGDVNYDRAKINQNSVVLTDSTGQTHEYTYTSSGNYKPPVNEDGQLVRNGDGTFTLMDTDGRTYVFNADGTLQSVTSPTDDRKPAALQYQYTGTPAKIQYIRDGVDPTNRYAQVYYSGDSACGSAPTGFDTAAPANMLCAVKTNDGRATYFYYKNGQLARIAKPGNELADYQYDGYGRITAIRDSLASDAIAASVRADDNTALTEITYDVLGRASSITQPAATTGATRIAQTFEYLPGSTGYAGAAQEHVTGAAEPNGFTRRVEYDSLFRTTRDTDVANLSTTQEWDATKDLLLSTTDATGLKSTTIYDDEDRPTDSYGPAPSSYYGTDRKPTSTYVSTVPHTSTGYDEGISGPSVAWYNTRLVTDSGTVKPLLYGAPKLHTTGIVPTDPTYMGRNLTTNPAPISVDSGNDNIAFSATGKIVFPQTGTYTFKYWHDDGARLYIDDTSLFADADWWHLGESQIVSQATFNATAGQVYRFRFDFVNRNAQYQSESWLAGPGITDTSGSGLGTTHWGTYVRPDYSLTTSSKTYDSTIGDTTTTTNYGSTPELGLAQSTAVDPTGLNLTTSSTYETQGATGSFLRQTSSSLPSGAPTNYTYYGATDTADNPCTTGTTEAYREGGMLKIKTEPDPDGAGSQTGRTTETIYDDAGQVVATRYNSDSWTCTTYDSRGRVTQVAIPAFGSAAARTVTNNYAVGGNPLVTSISDSTGTITTTMDLLGRTVSYTDVNGQTTTTSYDTLGRMSGRSGPLGTELYTYDSYNRPVDQKLDGTTYATTYYDAYGRLDHVTYPTASSQALAITRDSLGRTSGYSYTLGNGTAGPSDSITRSQSGQIVSGTELGASKSYTYDKAGRLTAATIGSNTFAYGYGTESSNCNSFAGNNTNAGKDSNRTTQTVNGATTTYCYDYADRLISSSNATVSAGAYDTHGNTTSLGSGTATTLTYDSSDRNTSITEGTKTTTYERDAQGRLTKRTLVSGGTTVNKYGYTTSADTPGLLLDNSGTVIEKYLQLPGGVVLTIRSSSKVYNLPNIHGDIFATTDANGTLLSTTLTGPFGEPISGQTAPNNTAANSTYGWVGQNEKDTETSFILAPTQMGARVYIPGLGRFTAVDPVQGGTANNYTYPNDPVGDFDLSGNVAWKKDAKTTWNTLCGGWWVLTCVPGIGLLGKGVQAGKYAIRGTEVGAKAVKAARVAENAKKGKAAEAEAYEQYVKWYGENNVTLHGKGSGVNTPAGWRFPDLIVNGPNGKFYAEVKSGNSAYTRLQQAKDSYILKEYGTPTELYRMP